MTIDNWAHGLESRHHKKAVALLREKRKELDKKPVRFVPQGFSYEWEKIKKKTKKE